MLFNSIEFLIFLSLLFVLYWFVFNNSLKLQNLLILVSSYIFYGWWDYRFLSLILLTTIIDYVVALNINKQSLKRNQKILLICSIIFNLSLLGVFKYYNFFVESWIDLLNSIVHKNVYRVFPHKLFCNTEIKGRCMTHDEKNIFYADDDHPSKLSTQKINILIMNEINKINSDK